MSQLLPMLLLLLHLALTISAQREPLTEKKICIPFGLTVLTESRFGRFSSCPCFFRGYAFTTLPHATLLFSLYAVPLDDYEKWRIDLQSNSSSPPPTSNAVALKRNKLTKYDPAIGKYVWHSGIRSVNETGNFVMFSLIDSGNTSVCVTVGLILEPKPTICPLRLAGPNSRPATKDNATTENATTANVVGGTRVDIDEFATYNAMTRTTAGNCSASLIADDWILTAAHCRVVIGTPVLIGGTDFVTGERRTVSATFQHPEFNRRNSIDAIELVNDIALAKLSKPVQKGQPISLNSNARGPAPGTIVRATGYGKRTTFTSSNHLNMVDNVVLSQEECKDKFFAMRGDRVARGLNATLHLCTGRDDDCEEGGVCAGDSGGPIVARTRGGVLVQIGITSYGDSRCGLQQVPDVFVRVSQYVPWVTRVTKGKAQSVAWESIGNTIDDSIDPSSAGDNEPVARNSSSVPVWAVALAAAFGGFLVIVVVLVGVAKFVPRRRDAASGDI